MIWGGAPKLRVYVCVDSSVIGGGVSHRTKWVSGGGGVSLTHVYTPLMHLWHSVWLTV